MAWQIKIHTLNVGQGDAQIIEVWDKVEGRDKEFIDWKKDRSIKMDEEVIGEKKGIEIEFDGNADSLKKFAQEYVEWKKSNNKVMEEKVLPKYQAILIDGGPKKWNSVRNCDVIHGFIIANNIKLTKLLLTHFDNDHYGGWFELINKNQNITFLKRLKKCREYLEKDKELETFKFHILFGTIFDIENFNSFCILDEHDDIIPVKSINIIKKLKKNEIPASDIVEFNNYINKLEEFYISNAYKEPFLKNIDIYTTDSTTRGNEKNEDVFWRQNVVSILIDKEAYLVLNNIDDRVIDDEGEKKKIKRRRRKFVLSNKPKRYKPEGYERENRLYTKFGIKGVNINYTVLNHDSLGSDLLGFNVGPKKLECFDLQKNVYVPGLYIVVGAGGLYKFPQKGKKLRGTSTWTNSSSVGLLLVYNTFTYLTAGDLTDISGTSKSEGAINKELIEYSDEKRRSSNLESLLAKNLNVNGYTSLSVMKIGHHGSKEGTAKFVLDSLRPNQVIISCGEKYTHSHPTREVIHRLNQCNDVKRILYTNSGPRYGFKDSWGDIRNIESYNIKLNTISEENRKKNNEFIWLESDVKKVGITSIREYFEEYLNNRDQVLLLKSDNSNFEFIMNESGEFDAIQDKSLIISGSLSNLNLYSLESSIISVKLENNKMDEEIMMFETKVSNPKDIIELKKRRNAIIITEIGKTQKKKGRNSIYSKTLNDTHFKEMENIELSSTKSAVINKLIPINNLSIIDNFNLPFCYSQKQTDQNWIWSLNDISNLKINITSLEVNNLSETKSPLNYIPYSAKAEGYLILSNKDSIINTDLKVNLSLNTTNLVPYWEFSLNKPATILPIKILSVKSLATSLTNADFRPFEIPDTLSDLFDKVTDGLQLNRFEGTFYTNPDFSSEISIDVSMNKSWDLIENKLTIENIGFELDLEPDSISGGVYGTFNFKNVKKEAILYIGMDTETTWTLCMYGKPKKDDTGAHEPLPNLVEIGQTFFDYFPIESIPFIAEMNEPSNPKLDITEVQMRVNFQAKNKIRELAVNTTITINDIKFNILLYVYPNWKIRGYLDTTEKVTVGKMMKSLGLSTINSIAKIEIKKAAIEASTKDYGIDISLGDVYDFTIGGKKVELQETSIGIRYRNAVMSGEFSATLLVAESTDPKCGCNDDDYIEDTVFTISAAYNGKWNFAGSLSGNISLEILTDWLKDTFDISLPAWVENLHLVDASIAFSTDSSYSFHLELFAPLSESSNDDDDVEKGLDVLLTISNDIDGLKFNGTVYVEDNEFIIDFQKGDEKGTKFLAKFKNDKYPISLKDIITDIGLEDTLSIPDYLNAEFNEASLEYDSGTEHSAKSLTIKLTKKDEYDVTFLATQLPVVKEKEGKFSWLYAFKVGITKVDINLYSLPLVGEDLKKINAQLSVKNIAALLLSRSVSMVELINLTLISKQDSNDEQLGIATLICDLVGADSIYPVRVTMGGLKKKVRKARKNKASAIQTLELTESGAYSPPGNDSLESAEPSITWKKINKKLGPLNIKKLGFEFKESKLTLHIDASISAGPVTIGFDDFWLASPINKFEPEAGLNALIISYITDVVKIDGSFARVDKNTYSGSAMVGIKSFNLAAMGAYSNKAGETSMFIYAMLMDPPIGGPSMFYITGLALGFGYNRNIILPDVDNVKNFPLVTPFIGGNNSIILPSEALNQLTQAKLVPMEMGQQWIVAGVRFTSYKMINSFGLFSVKFGNKLEFGLTGLSILATPDKANPLVYAELAIDARILPEEGVVAINGKLTPESYLFDKNCKLTGGFAFYMWFGDNPHSGDFVATIGGYHPRFVIPSHYPQVPRLGFDWKVSDNLMMKGDLYFALTSSCIMAGGRFEAYFQSGEFRAWFIMGADFIISWKPYFYEADIYITFGISYTFRINVFVGTITKSISASFGARLSVWGPDFSGIATIDLGIISLSVKFGDTVKKKSGTINWEEFKGSFLPSKASGSEGTKPLRRSTNYTTAKEESGLNYLKFNVVSGQLLPNDFENRNLNQGIELKQHNIVFDIITSIPAYEIQFYENEGTQPEIFVRMVGEKLEGSKVNIVFKKDGSELNDMVMEVIPLFSNLSAAMWGKKLINPNNIKEQEESMVMHMLTGVRIEIKVENPKEGITIDKSKFVFANPKKIEVKMIKRTKIFSNKKAILNLREKNSLRDDLFNIFIKQNLVSNEAKLKLDSKVPLVLRGEPKEEEMFA